MCIRSDGENPITALVRAAASNLKEKGVEVLVEQTPVSDSKAAGAIERTHWEVQGLTRTLCHQLRELHEVELHASSPLVVRAVRGASQLINRFQKSSITGRTPYEARRGKPFKRELPPFGESVMYMRVGKSDKKAKFDDRFLSGLFLGLSEKSQEFLVGTEDGTVKKVNVIKRVVSDKRKDKAAVEKLKGLPWDVQGLG